MASPNYLIGFGQRLVHPITLRTGGGDKAYPLSFEEARKRLTPLWAETLAAVGTLPEAACPNDEAVIAITLYPAFLARTYYPSNLLRDMGFRHMGSRVRPPASSHNQSGDAAPEIFVAGGRKALDSFVKDLPDWNPALAVQDEFRRIMDVRALDDTRLRPIAEEDDAPPLEVVLHAGADEEDEYIVSGFRDFAASFGMNVDVTQRLHAGGLCFIPMRGLRKNVDKLTSFSFVRTIRRMPRLSLNESLIRTLDIPRSFEVKLPNGTVLNDKVRVAVFDGGLPVAPNPVELWARALDADGVGPAAEKLQSHGLAVTSALLFGPLRDRDASPVPYAMVDHWRVLDQASHGDDFELVVVLRRILSVLRQRKYEFVCLSIGPDLPIEDDDVHLWTSNLDALLVDGTTVMAAACGNSGEYDWDSGNARVQPPSDAVNAIGIGAATTEGSKWERAPYSSVGRGRSPGIVKPDLVSFGGSDKESFHVIDQYDPTRSDGRMGTSYSAPNGLRIGIGMKAHFGDQLFAPAIRALMIHHADRGRRSQREVGWGRLPSVLNDLVVCRDGEVTVVYEGKLEPSHFIRFPIPLPRGRLGSSAMIKATFCLFTPVDPEDSINYTRAGLSIFFRPITVGSPGVNLNGKPRSAHPAARFFRPDRLYSTENQDRKEGYKWEPVYKASGSFEAGELDQPVFDVQHHTRSHGRPAARRSDICYGLVVTISAPLEADLYNRVLVAYPTQLEALRPTIELPIVVRGGGSRP
jgi:hypothetical protein